MLVTIPTNDIDPDRPVVLPKIASRELREGTTTALTIDARQITEPTTLAFIVAGPLDQPVDNHLINFNQDRITDLTILASDDDLPSLNQPATITLTADSPNPNTSQCQAIHPHHHPRS